jgi:iron complex outermembrane recepter protein
VLFGASVCRNIFETRFMNHPARRRLNYLALSLSMIWGHAYAQSDEESYFSDLPTVLSASRLAQPLDEVPGAVTVLDRDLIRATGYRDIARVLRLVPGIQTGQMRGGKNWVSYHGLSMAVPSGLQVLVDGRSVYTQSSFDGVDFSALPITIDEIERIEVVRGPNPVSYGANAFMGSINIITREAAEDPGARAHVNFGQPGVRDVAAGGNGLVGPVAVRLDASYSDDDGFEDLRDRSRVGVVAARADYRPTNADKLVLRLGASSTVKGEGYPNTLFNNNAERDSHGNYTNAHLEWSHTSAPGNEWRVDLYHNREAVRDQWAVTGPSFYPVVIPFDRDRVGTRDNIEFHHRFPVGDTARFVWGAEMRSDKVQGANLYAGGDPSTSVLRRFFGDTEWKFAPRWQLTVGAAVEQELNDPARISPRAFLNWHASENQSWRVGYSRVMQQKSIFLRESDVRFYDPTTHVLLAQPYRSNPDLRQARFDSIELGYFGRIPSWGLSLDGRLFRERAKDFVYRVAVPSDQTPTPALQSFIPTTQFQNYDKPVTLTGIEYELKARVWKGGEMRFVHTLINRNSGNWLIDHLTAPYVATLSWIQKYQLGWSSTVSVLRMGAMTGGDVTDNAASLAKPYTAVDARIAYAFEQSMRKWEVALNAINLGKKHSEMSGRVAQTGGGSISMGNVSPMVYLSITGEI